jgi:beta-glucosidase
MILIVINNDKITISVGGAATSSHQVEGGVTNNDWDFFTRSEPIKKRISTLTKPSIFYKNSIQIVLQPAGDAVKFWDPRYYEKDFDLARSLGLNTFRIGIEWARIEPERGQWDQEAIEHYRKMISAMRERGLVPVISLNHATLPLWVLTPPSNVTKKNRSEFTAATSTKTYSTWRSPVIRSLLEISSRLGKQRNC